MRCPASIGGELRLSWEGGWVGLYVWMYVWMYRCMMERQRLAVFPACFLVSEGK